MTPKKIYVPEDSIKCLCHYDNSALALVTNSQKTGSVEYTDLSQVWHSTYEIPSGEKPIIYETKNYKFGVLNNVDPSRWNWYVNAKYSIIIWAYADDLIPKGGDQ